MNEVFPMGTVMCYQRTEGSWLYYKQRGILVDFFQPDNSEIVMASVSSKNSFIYEFTIEPNMNRTYQVTAKYPRIKYIQKDQNSRIVSGCQFEFYDFVSFQNCLLFLKEDLGLPTKDATSVYDTCSFASNIDIPTKQLHFNEQLIETFPPKGSFNSASANAPNDLATSLLIKHLREMQLHPIGTYDTESSNSSVVSPIDLEGVSSYLQEAESTLDDSIEFQDPYVLTGSNKSSFFDTNCSI